jgi:hypothetical protein
MQDATDYYLNQYLNKLDEHERLDEVFDRQVFKLMQTGLTEKEAMVKLTNPNLCKSCFGDGCPQCEGE